MATETVTPTMVVDLSDATIKKLADSTGVGPWAIWGGIVGGDNRGAVAAEVAAGMREADVLEAGLVGVGGCGEPKE